MTPEGKVDPLARAYEIVESESVAVALTEMLKVSTNDPRDPLAVVHTGLALIYSAFGIMPNKFDVFVTLILYGSLALDKPVKTAVT